MLSFLILIAFSEAIKQVYYSTIQQKQIFDFKSNNPVSFDEYRQTYDSCKSLHENDLSLFRMYSNYNMHDEYAEYDQMLINRKSTLTRVKVVFSITTSLILYKFYHFVYETEKSEADHNNSAVQYSRPPKEYCSEDECNIYSYLFGSTNEIETGA